MRKMFTFSGSKVLAAALILFLSAAAVQADDAAEKNTAYWVDAATGNRISQLDLSGPAVIRLFAEVPAGKVLKAYSVAVTYEDGCVALTDAAASPDSGFPPMNINDQTDGLILANGLKTGGVKGEDGKVLAVALLDLTVESAKPGTSFISVMFSCFGSGYTDEFRPEIEPLKVLGK